MSLGWRSSRLCVNTGHYIKRKFPYPLMLGNVFCIRDLCERRRAFYPGRFGSRIRRTNLAVGPHEVQSTIGPRVRTRRFVPATLQNTWSYGWLL